MTIKEYLNEDFYWQRFNKLDKQSQDEFVHTLNTDDITYYDDLNKLSEKIKELGNTLKFKEL